MKVRGRSRQGTWHKEDSLSEKGRELKRIMGDFDQRLLCMYRNVKECFLKRQNSKNVSIFCISFKASHDKKCFSEQDNPQGAAVAWMPCNQPLSNMPEDSLHKREIMPGTGNLTNYPGLVQS